MSEPQLAALLIAAPALLLCLIWIVALGFTHHAGLGADDYSPEL
jgi:hypothetical protein